MGPEAWPHRLPSGLSVGTDWADLGPMESGGRGETSRQGGPNPSPPPPPQGSCTLVAMGVYSGESWHRNLDPQIQLSFAWSFYLGWAALPLLGLSGEPGRGAGCRGERMGEGGL
uniref:Uncharacterized protein n=1 Tax=Chelydra serpentina TaxID=8475 RepID=A0A8C3SP55_CHESE